MAPPLHEAAVFPVAAFWVQSGKRAQIGERSRSVLIDHSAARRPTKPASYGHGPRG